MMRFVAMPNKNENRTLHEMADLVTVKENGKRDVFGTVHVDFFWEEGCTSNEKSANYRLQHGEEVIFEMVEVVDVEEV